jgi:alanine racemase
MTTSRRTFLSAVGAAGLGALSPTTRSGAADVRAQSAPAGLDPWIEVDAAALRANARAVASLAGGRPVLAVIKNNAYGLGTVEVARALQDEEGVAGFAVVKVSEALDLRESGITKPVLHMGATTGEQAEALVRAAVRLALFDPADPARLSGLARAAGGPVPAHVYVDTGMSRLGVPAHRALAWLRELARGPVRVEGTFMGLTESDFDAEQLARFGALARSARGEAIDLGRLHAASSHALFLRPEARLDMVRPGLALFGAYPSGSDAEAARLTPAFRLRARVARVEHLRAGDSVSYGRNWVAERPTWTATLPVGHADGYPRRAVDGCEVLIGDRLHPVVGAVSASHAIVVLGDEPTARVGDIATLVGPDDPAIHPNEVARRAGVSVYDVLMHLGQNLPRVVV